MTTIIEEARVVLMMYCMLVLFVVMLVCCPCSHVLKEVQKKIIWGLAQSLLSGVVISHIYLLSILIISSYFLLPYVIFFVRTTLAHSTTTYCQMVDTIDDINGINTNYQSQQMSSTTQLSSEQAIAWQAQILEMATEQMDSL